ncbi:hypothetical protein EBESD8_58330 [Rhodococcus aetherivorans]|nr:hypothetical protein EBESD8_58330 [Rhodococcus aetherivorans]
MLTPHPRPAPCRPSSRRPSPHGRRRVTYPCDIGTQAGAKTACAKRCRIVSARSGRHRAGEPGPDRSTVGGRRGDGR